MLDGKLPFIVDNMSQGQRVGHRDGGIKSGALHIQRVEDKLLHNLCEWLPADILREKACHHQAEIAISEKFAWFGDERILWQLLAYKSFQSRAET